MALNYILTHVYMSAFHESSIKMSTNSVISQVVLCAYRRQKEAAKGTITKCPYVRPLHFHKLLTLWA